MKHCHDCDAAPGQMHMLGCDVETCPLCGGQMISCGCNPSEIRVDARMPWLGYWTGDKECEEYDFWHYFIEGRGWKRCPKDHPEAAHDLTRLHLSCDWDPEQQRFVKREEKQDVR